MGATDLPLNPGADVSRLGPLNKEYRATTQRLKTGVTLTTLFLLLFAGLGLYLGILAARAKEPALLLSLAAVPLLLALWMLVLLLVYLRRQQWRILLYQNGFLLDRNGSNDVVRWEEIKYMYERMESGIGGEHILRLTMLDGRRFKMNDSTFEGFDSFVAVTREHVTQCVLLTRQGRKSRHRGSGREAAKR